ncbi:DUF302 domain-containing protein [uncultured Thiohalocapsa sp.]|uniref:DUF302 domain-containing protein n=1 Tax=uncultured Thiohalocapsa sp. TaxID=768990 RepID=UPI0025CC0DEB|nr:DUF302 domain-containing protein [uncultured Thiohalocapsa sp.]
MNTFTTPLSADEAIDALKHGVDAVGLRVVAHINGQANAKLIGQEVPADQILEIFRPDFAIRVWEACKPAGHDIPLRIHVYDDQGTTKVACRMPGTVFAAFDSPALDAIGAELDALFAQILAQVPQA